MRGEAPLTLQNNSLPILQVDDDFLRIRTLNSFLPGQNFLIVRPVDDDDPEVIANGKLRSQKKNEATISFDPGLVKKRPNKNDFVILLGSPKQFADPPASKKSKGDDFLLSTPVKPEPGYIQFKYLQLDSSLDSTSPNQANSLKKIGKFPRTGFELEWFTEFLPSYGFSLSQMHSTIPITDYFHNPVPGSFDQTVLKLMFRTEKHAFFRGLFYFQSLSEKFNTENGDEYVLSTSLAVNGLGAAVIYEKGKLLPITPSWSYSWTSAKLSLVYGFSTLAQDGAISRGQSNSGNSYQELRFALDSTAYLPIVPYVKRWILGVEFYQRALELQFSGTTVGENVGGAYVIPSNQRYKENESGFFITLGARFEDVIGQAFKPRE